ncbi:OLC1v1026348C1 [Oldenlandia corymbosa var. corymbosa]|uniref:OLC1v1026348C1 n=1 Tax=Oldenlandia corymbosa var. corymbosa TaxID=529605 RepID=A0AAV1C7A3_OLDCO|nr:OLC1v1026348C1 [Oldenlandia corymbosa var. corymbosa]
MERQNADLFLANYRMMLENKRLKKRVEQLREENQLLAANMEAQNGDSNNNAGPSSSANQQGSKKAGQEKKM